ncbi:IspD/TarI family cytidylyltransferase [Glycomyces salinus]|uniref:IspD/TarI family cytidylyltransferase n=1 Tax=Glycomyces salinus TaxID=980294 RepID=UPI0018EAF25A|nr:IspD/TarI family cytidylyltransferase [Glycomyces salinus]
MRNTRPTVAAVLAGGQGTRMGAALPKQFIDLAGKPVLGHALEAFDAAEAVDRILVVGVERELDRIRRIAAGSTKFAGAVAGGATRSESSKAAVRWTEDHFGTECDLLIHDAARALVTPNLINRVASGLERHAAVTAAVPSRDTVVQVRHDQDGEFLSRSLERDELRRVQTPQAFHLAVIRDAYRAAETDPDFSATDDCSVVLRYLPHIPVAAVAGDERNLKVTEPLDLAVAGALLEADGV